MEGATRTGRMSREDGGFESRIYEPRNVKDCQQTTSS